MSFVSSSMVLNTFFFSNKHQARSTLYRQKDFIIQANLSCTIGFRNHFHKKDGFGRCLLLLPPSVQINAMQDTGENPQEKICHCKHFLTSFIP